MTKIAASTAKSSTAVEEAVEVDPEVVEKKVLDDLAAGSSFDARQIKNLLGVTERPSSTPDAKTRMDVVMRIRTAAPEMPYVKYGTHYAVGDNFEIPFDDALARAAQSKLKVVDYVVAEAAMQYANRVFGDVQATRLRGTNKTLAFVSQLGSDMITYRALAARYPKLGELCKAYITERWSKALENLERSVPANLMNVFVEVLARGADLTLRRPRGVAPTAVGLATQAAKTIKEATRPPSTEELTAQENDRTAARLSFNRALESVKSTAMQAVESVVKLSLPQPDVQKVSASSRRVVEKREKPTEVSADEKATKALRVLRNDRTLFGDSGDVPSPTRLGAAVERLMTAGRIDEESDVDGLVDGVIRLLDSQHSRDEGRFSDFSQVTGDEKPAWSWDYLKLPNASRLEGLLKVPELPSYYQGSRGRRDGLGSFLLGRSAPQSWIGSGEKRKLADVKANTKFVAELARCEGFSGVVGRHLQELGQVMVEAVERTREDDLSENLMYRLRRPFDDAAENFFGLMELVPISDLATGGVLNFIGLGESAGERWQRFRDSASKVADNQRAARRVLDSAHRRFRPEIERLYSLVEPRLRWFDDHDPSAAKHADELRATDPVAMAIDGAWLPMAAAKLRRAELLAEQIRLRIEELPDELPMKGALETELQAAGNLEAGLVGETANRLWEQLTDRKIPVEVADGAEGVAAYRSRALPFLARFPRLSSLATLTDILEGGMEVDATLQPVLVAAKSGVYVPRFQDARYSGNLLECWADFEFWSRTFDPAAAPADFLAELFQWRLDAAAPLDGWYDPSLVQGFLGSVDDLALLGGDSDVPWNGTAEVSEALAELKILSPKVVGSDRHVVATAKYLHGRKYSPEIQAETARILGGAVHSPRAKSMLEQLFDSPSREVRLAALSAWVKISQVDRKTVYTMLFDGGIPGLSHRDQCLAALDILHASLSPADSLAAANAALSSKIPAVRATAATVLTSVVEQCKDAEIASLALRGAQDKDAGVASAHSQVLEALIDSGSTTAAEEILGSVDRTPKHDWAALLHRLGESRALPSELSLRGRALLTARKGDIAEARARAARSVKPSLKRRSPPTDLGGPPDLIVAAAQHSGGSPTNARELYGATARLKIGLKLMGDFELWAARQSSTRIKNALDELDLSVGVLEDAVADVRGDDPRGYLRDAPEILSALSDAAGFSAADIEVFRTGRIPDDLRTLSRFPAALDGSWSTQKLGDVLDSPDAYDSLLALKLWLSDDQTAHMSELIGHLLDADTPPATAAVAFRGLEHATGVAMPCLDPSLTDTERMAGAFVTKKPSGLVGDMLLAAVRDRFCQSAPDSIEARLLVAYLESGDPDAAARQITEVAEQAPTFEHFGLTVAAAGRIVRNKTDADGGRDLVTASLNRGALRRGPWLPYFVTRHSGISTELLQNIRDVMVGAASSLADGGDSNTSNREVIRLFDEVIEEAGPPDSDYAQALGDILIDSDDTAGRRAKVDALIAMAASPLDVAQLQALRSALQRVTQGTSRVAGPDLYEAFLEGIGRIHRSSTNLGVDEILKLGELFSQGGDPVARTVFMEGLGDLYHRAGVRAGTMGVEFLTAVGDWVAQLDAKTGSHRIEPNRRSVISALRELMPLEPDAIRQLGQMLVHASGAAETKILAVAKERKRNGKLDLKALQKIGDMRDDTDTDDSSSFGGIVGSAIKQMWNFSSGTTYIDPLSNAFGDAPNVRRAKRAISSALSMALDDLELVRRLAGQYAFDFGSRHGATGFALGAWAGARRAADGTYSAEAGKVVPGQKNQGYDMNAEMVALRQDRAAFREKFIANLSPWERCAKLNASHIRGLAASLDRLAELDEDIEWRYSSANGRLVPNRWVQWQIEQQLGAVESEGETAAVAKEVPKIFRVPGMPPDKAKLYAVGADVGFVVDYSGSTDQKDANGVTKLEHFKSFIVQGVEALERVKKFKTRSSVIAFSNSAHMTMEAAESHGLTAKEHSVNLRPATSTNDVAGLTLGVNNLENSPAKVKALVFFTDGEGKRSDMLAAVRDARRRGIVVVAVCVGEDADVVARWFGGAEHVLVANSMEEAARGYFTFFRDKVLLKVVREG